jgi:hypothetical protein
MEPKAGDQYIRPGDAFPRFTVVGAVNTRNGWIVELEEYCASTSDGDIKSVLVASTETLNQLGWRIHQ